MIENGDFEDYPEHQHREVSEAFSIVSCPFAALILVVGTVVVVWAAGWLVMAIV